MAQTLAGGAFSVDRSPIVSIEIGASGATFEYKNVEEYCYDTDVLTLGDPFAVTLSNIDGDYGSTAGNAGGKINLGDSVKLYVQDPDVAGGAKTLKLQGIVTGIDYESTVQGGTKIVVRGADLGWHLANNPGPLFKRYRNKTINQILKDAIDPSWGIKDVRQGNDFNRTIKLGRAGVPALGANIAAILPPIQFEPGQSVADVLIPLARRQKYLINVSADGRLQFFRPDYSKKPLYALHFHKATEKSRFQNNVESVALKTSLDGFYSSVTCVGQVLYPPPNTAPGNPNEGKIRGDYQNLAASNPAFSHKASFSDGDQMTRPDAVNRAQWKWQRGRFDSWVYEAVVRGHSQSTTDGGNFYESDTMVEINDTVHGVTGNYYVSACRYSRTLGGGTRTTLTIRQPGTLGA